MVTQTLMNVGKGLLALTVLTVVFYGVQPSKVARHRGGAFMGQTGGSGQDY